MVLNNLLKLVCPKLSRHYRIRHCYSTCSNVVNNTHSVPAVSSPDFRVLFLGNDSFSLESLKVISEIIASKDCLKVIISHPKNVVGKYVTDNKLHHTLWTDFKSPENNETFHVGVVASFGYLLPKRVIEKCKLGILNVHGSLLPKYRGAAPVAHAIMNGDSETGISIMKIAPHKFDIGPILSRQKCPIHPDVRAPELTSILAKLGSQSLKESLLNLQTSIHQAEEQTNDAATLAPKLTPDLSNVNWESLSALQVYNLFRSLYGLLKLNTMYNGKKVDLDNIGLVRKINSPVVVDNVGALNEATNRKTTNFTQRTDFSKFYPSLVSISINALDAIWNDSNNNFVPGQVVVVKRNFVLIKCADDGWVFCQKFKIGTKWMSARDFQNGFLSKTKGPHLFHYSPHNNEHVSTIKSVGT